MFVRAYLRASTDEQDATRARQQLDAFASDHGLHIAAYYIENESGAKLARPELFRLLSDARPGDVLLVEQVDRLSRLTASDWEKLKAELATRRVRVVALDLPTSWMMATGNGDDFTARMFDAINGMMLDVLAAVARKDYEDRRRRQAQGQTRAKAEGRYRGRKENVARNAGIASMLKGGVSWSQIQAATGCSRATIAKIAKRAGSNFGTAGFSKARVRRPGPLVCTEAGSGG
ncbi:MAG TPA: recombinase family protein [Gemmatimonadales bacterium]|nr:recombinase family protein [Gemmatimonadales bacterium]